MFCAMDSDLQRVADQRAITDTAIRYTWALDQKKWAELDTVFAADATAMLGSPGVLEGRTAIVERISSALSIFVDSQHLVGNHQVVVDGNTGTHRCYLQAQHISSDGGLWMVAGRYEDQLERLPEGWRITHRDLIVMWTQGDRPKPKSSD